MQRGTSCLSRLKFPLIVVACLAAASATADAQSPTVPALARDTAATNAVLSRLRRLASDSSQIQRLAHSLLDSIGPRLTGTPDLKRGNDWLVRKYSDWGISARNERTGTWRGWRRGHSHIDLVSPRVRTLDGTMLGYSPGTNRTDVTAEAIILPRFTDSTEFVKWLPQARGRLVLVSMPQPTCRPGADWRSYGTDSAIRELVRVRDSLQREWVSRNVRGTGYSLAIGTGELGVRLEQGGVAGIITSRPKDAQGTIEVFETYNTRAPAIALSCEDYGLIFRLAESGSGPRIRMNLDAELLGETPVFNTVATIRGSAKPDEFVVLSAHFDSWDGASGATDNGTGTLMMMEAMRSLKTAYPRPRRTIIAGHWQGEEQGGAGSRAFAEDHPEIIRGMQALFNQDNGTGRVLRISGAGLPDAAQQLEAWLAALPGDVRERVSYRAPGSPAGPGSDDYSFSCRGVPAFSLNSVSWNYGSSTWHSNRDTYDKVVFEDLKFNVTLVAMLAFLASEDPELISRERIQDAGWPECEPGSRTTRGRLRE